MKTQGKPLFILSALTFLLGLSGPPAWAQGTAFTYQGRLDEGGAPASGLYDFRFKLFLDPLGNTQAGTSFLTNGLAVSNGLFVATPDFGPALFTGTNYWLEVDVKTNAASFYTALAPLQPITPTPYAIFANTASNLAGTLTAAQVTGALPPADLSGTYGSVLTLNNPGNNFSGSFAGDGSGLSNVDATALGGLSAAGFWQLSGNSVGTNQFIGSTNNQAVELWAGNLRVLRLEPDSRNAKAGNLVGGYIGNGIQQPGSGGDVIAGGGIGGATNMIYTNSSGVFIGAGSANQVGPGVNDAVIVGGFGNRILAAASVIDGGVYNTNGASYSVLGGGWQNLILSSSTAVGSAFLGGGNYNVIASNSLAAVLVGGYGNSIQSDDPYGWIGGGYNNSIEPTNSSSAIGGGSLNRIQTGAAYSIIGGGYNNWIGTNSPASAILGGSYNSVQRDAGYSLVAGGYANSIQGDYLYSSNGSPVASAVLGGYINVIQTNSPFSVIAGGYFNVIQTNSAAAAVGGGSGNQVTTGSGYATVSGGTGNIAGGAGATVAGGQNNSALGFDSFAAGTHAQATNYGSFVLTDGSSTDFYSSSNNQFSARFYGGVRFETAGSGMTLDGAPVLTASSGSIGFSLQSNTNGAPNVIEGSPVNFATPGVVGATVGGGGAVDYSGSSYTNSVTADFGTVSGGLGNEASGAFAAVGGGQLNTASDFAATIGGGSNNRATNSYSVVGGGFLNLAAGDPSYGGYTVVGGGLMNSATGFASVIAGGGGYYGGDGNIAGGDYSFIGGGYANRAYSYGAVIAGGYANQATNQYATVPGGYENIAGGRDSLAAGNSAQALHQGAFVWADSTAGVFSSTTNDEFSIRAQNGVRIQTDRGIHLNAADRPLIVRDWDVFATNAPGYKAGIGRWGLFMEPTILTIGIPSNDVAPRYFQVAKYSTNGSYAALMKVDQAGNVYATGSVYANGVLLTSDRNAKENFKPLNVQDVLDKVAALPLSEWNYKTDGPGQKHLGPMAQDFHAAFGLNGSDDKHISVVDENGVALAAIQGLNEKLEEKDAEISELKQAVNQLRQMMTALTQKLNSPASQPRPGPAAGSP